jgi:hypothetical protein
MARDRGRGRPALPDRRLARARAPRRGALGRGGSRRPRAAGGPLQRPRVRGHADGTPGGGERLVRPRPRGGRSALGPEHRVRGPRPDRAGAVPPRSAGRGDRHVRAAARGHPGGPRAAARGAGTPAEHDPRVAARGPRGDLRPGGPVRPRPGPARAAARRGQAARARGAGRDRQHVPGAAARRAPRGRRRAVERGAGRGALDRLRRRAVLPVAGVGRARLGAHDERAPRRGARRPRGGAARARRVGAHVLPGQPPVRGARSPRGRGGHAAGGPRDRRRDRAHDGRAQRLHGRRRAPVPRAPPGARRDRRGRGGGDRRPAPGRDLAPAHLARGARRARARARGGGALGGATRAGRRGEAARRRGARGVCEPGASAARASSAPTSASCAPRTGTSPPR